MAKLEKFGSFVLLEEVGSDCAGRVYRAAKVRSTGLEKIVYLTKIHPSLAQNTALMKSLMDELKVCAQVSSPNIAKVYGCGKLEGAYFISWEFVEGKDLGTVFTRSLDGFPLAVDQSLYILSRILGALETAHAARIEDKGVLHGALSPVDVILTYEGDVKVKNFNFAQVLVPHPNERKEALKRIETYLSPEVQDGKPPDKRSDIYALGLILYRMLTGEPFFTESREIDVKQRLESSVLMAPFQDDDKIPAPLSDIIARCVNPNPAHRFPSVKEFRQAIDAILLSGDFTPSTFNLAFYMHTAFRSEIETENKQMQEEQAMDFLKYAVLEPPPAPAQPPARPAEPAPAVQKVAAPEAPKVAAPAAAQPVAARPAPPARAAEVPMPSLGYEQPKKSPVAIIAAIVAVVLLGGSLGVYFGVIKPKQRRAAEQAALLAEQKKMEGQRKRLLELEAQMKASEAEKEKYRQDLQALLDAEKQAKDKADKDAQARIQAEIQKRQEEQKQKDEAAKRQAEEAEKIRLDQEAKQREAEEAAIAEQKKAAEEEERKRKEAEDEAKRRAELAAQVQEGQLVSLESADTKPKIVKSKQPTYPPMALKMGVGGTVTVSVLVSETGAVVDVKLKKPSGSKYGLDEAAMDAARKYQFTPALKSGKRVKVWYDLPIFQFTPPR
ncbi:MAG: TonB family protein [Acidobacteriota bacterium]